MNIDTRIIIRAASIVAALGTLGTAVVYGTSAAVTSVGGANPPYTSRIDFVQVAEQAKQTSKDTKATAGVAYRILLQQLLDEAESCDDRTTVLNIQARATHNADLQDQADRNDKRCSTLHDLAEKSRVELLNR